MLFSAEKIMSWSFSKVLHIIVVTHAPVKHLAEKQRLHIVL